MSSSRIQQWQGMPITGMWSKAAAAASAAAMVAGLVYLWKKQKRHSQRAPGPPGWPLIGHLPAMVRPDVHRILTQWANEYGGIYRLNVAGTMHVISDAKIANLVLTTRGEGKFLKSRMYDNTLELSWGIPSMFSTRVEDEKYQAWRKLILQCFSNENLKVILPIVRSCASNLVARWQDAQSGGTAVDLEDWLPRCFLDIICEAGFGLPGTAVLEGPNEFLHVVHDAFAEVTPTLFNPLLSLLYR
ncbi:cytochrome P450 [Dunaliella salina]|uniref:Cytochrome P450 n=1 Tax=Dunaliella salina TaxID=3046 RepID=A0ABQ7H2L3_DUNSA|nr:cytochrome P450 [Dunaliella salina]|eukprot:KAF5841099.1 cytochrome P450 [Dunaliella salina]